MSVSIKYLIEKRKEFWNQKHDLRFDKEYIEACLNTIFDDKNSHLINEIKTTPYLLIEFCFYIADKQGELMPFFFNDVQSDFISKFQNLGTSKPFYILKNRQQGITSLVVAMMLSYTITNPNFSSLLLADNVDNASAIFNDKCKYMYDKLPQRLKPKEKFNSKRELYFEDLHSSMRIATASDNVGRSKTLNMVHLSEVAFYDCKISDLQKGIGEALVKNAINIYETTANGFNEAKDLWDSNTCVNCFYEFYKTKEYVSKNYEYLETKDSWLAERIKLLKQLNLTKEQITWYAEKYCKNLDKNAMKQEYPINPIEAFVSSSDCVFDKEKINFQLAIKPSIKEKVGYFDYKKLVQPVKNNIGETVDTLIDICDIRFIENPNGYIKIHEDPTTEDLKDKTDRELSSSHNYALGGDTAGKGTDFFACKVVDIVTRKTVATLHKQRMDEDIFAEQVYCLGSYFNNALIGIETNYSYHPTRILQNLSYPNLYMRERVDTMMRKVEMVYGFETTQKTKPIIIANLVSLLREDISIETDVETLKELTTFVRKTNGKQEAIHGAHDDLVMALAIAHFIAGQQMQETNTFKTNKDIMGFFQHSREEEVEDFYQFNFYGG